MEINPAQIFLDFDMVLQPDRPVLPGARLPFDPGNIAVLNQIIAAAGAHIVVSSGWRWRYSLGALAAELAAAGIRGNLIASTPHPHGETDEVPAASRGVAILHWREGRAPGPPKIAATGTIGRRVGAMALRMLPDPGTGLAIAEIERGIAMTEEACRQ